MVLFNLVLRHLEAVEKLGVLALVLVKFLDIVEEGFVDAQLNEFLE